eukprot:3644412-Amphidinium_carterae.2
MDFTQSFVRFLIKIRPPNDPLIDYQQPVMVEVEAPMNAVQPMEMNEIQTPLPPPSAGVGAFPQLVLMMEDRSAATAVGGGSIKRTGKGSGDSLSESVTLSLCMSSPPSSWRDFNFSPRLCLCNACQTCSDERIPASAPAECQDAAFPAPTSE